MLNCSTHYVVVVHVIQVLDHLLLFPLSYVIHLILTPLLASAPNHVVLGCSDVAIKWLLACYRHLGCDHIVGHVLVEDVEHLDHGQGKRIRLFFATEVETIDLSVVPPLVECRRRLIILQAFEDRAVDHHLSKGQI